MLQVSCASPLGLMALGLASVLAAVGCTTTTGADDDGSADTEETSGTTEGDQTERWIVGNWISTDDAYLGYLNVVDDLSTAGSLDPSQAIEFGGDMMYASPGGGVVYVGLEEKPSIERWRVNSNGALTKDGEVSLSNFGVTTTLGGGRNVIQFVDDQLAYYFDEENFQVIKFNPEEMTTIDAFSIDGLAEDGQWASINFIHQDGTRFITTAAYWSLEDDTGTPLVRAVIVDSADDSVAYAEDTRCGVIGYHAAGQNGDLYFATHPGQSTSVAAGLEGDAPAEACMLRIKQGESSFDQDYYVGLAELSGGGVVGGLHRGNDNVGYLLQYAGDVAALNADNLRDALRGEAWELYSVELGNEDATYARVDIDEMFTAYADSFTTIVDGVETSFVIGVAGDFGSGTYFDVSDPTSVLEGLSINGLPGEAIAVH